MAVATPLSLKSILVPSKSIEIDYPGLNGFKVNVVFLSRETLVSIRKKSTKTSFKNRQATEEMDDKLFLQLYVNACIKGWTGLKLSYLEQLAPVDLSQHSPDDELPWDQDNALFLMQSSTNFDAFISETVSELANFTKTSTSK